MAYSFKSVQTVSNSMNETRDCSVKALALTTPASYQVAHKALADVGRQNRKGATLFQLQAAYKSLGYTMQEVKGITAKTIATIEADKKIKKSCKYLVHTSGHVIAIKGGKVLDWTAGRRHRVVTVYKIV